MGLCETGTFEFAALSLRLGEFLLGRLELLSDINLRPQFKLIHKQANLVHRFTFNPLFIDCSHQIGIGAGEEGSQDGRWKSKPLQALGKIQRYRLEPPLGKEKLTGLGGNTP